MTLLLKDEGFPLKDRQEHEQVSAFLSFNVEREDALLPGLFALVKEAVISVFRNLSLSFFSKGLS